MKKTEPFIPLLLPFSELVDTSAFLDELISASKKLVLYNEKISNCKVGSDIIFFHMGKREAFFSTKIEGTQTTLAEVYAHKDEVQKKDTAVAEVMRYGNAISFCAEQIDKFPISTRLLCNAHKILLGGGARGMSSGAGEYRTCQVWVGEHTPPPHNRVDEFMSNLERYINSELEDGLQPLVKCAIIHAQFETIHPFADGNGRMGRVLIPLYLFSKGEITDPHFFLSKALEQDKFRYYSFLQDTRKNTKEAYTQWIKFFLNAVVRQTSDDINLMEMVDALYEQINGLTENSRRSANFTKVLDQIFNQVIFTVKGLAEATGVPEVSVRNYVKTLKDLKIIFANDNKRNKLYYFYDLLNLIDGSFQGARF